MINIDYERIEKILNKYYKEELYSQENMVNLDYQKIDSHYPELIEALQGSQHYSKIA